MSTLDKSLDEIISAKKATLRPRRGLVRGRGSFRGRVAVPRKITTTPRVSDTSKVQQQNKTNPIDLKKKAAAVAANNLVINNSLGSTSVIEGSKIVVSNLPEDVREEQVKELFSTTVGPVKSVALTYDAKGNSKGIASVEFKNVADGAKAYNQYNKRLIDQKRPMKVEIVVDPTKAPPAPLTSRIAPAPAAPAVQPIQNGAVTRGVRGGVRGRGLRGGIRGVRGRGARGRGGKFEGRAKKTVEDLDQEMMDWQEESKKEGTK